MGIHADNIIAVCSLNAEIQGIGRGPVWIIYQPDKRMVCDGFLNDIARVIVAYAVDKQDLHLVLRKVLFQDRIDKPAYVLLLVIDGTN